MDEGRLEAGDANGSDEDDPCERLVWAVSGRRVDSLASAMVMRKIKTSDKAGWKGLIYFEGGSSYISTITSMHLWTDVNVRSGSTQGPDEKSHRQTKAGTIWSFGFCFFGLVQHGSFD